MPQPLRTSQDPAPIPPSSLPLDAAPEAVRAEEAQALALQLRERTQAMRALRVPAAEAEGEIEKVLRAVRAFVRRLVGGTPYTYRVAPCRVLTVNRTAHTCTVRLLEGGETLDHVQFGAQAPGVGGEYAARWTRRLDPLALRGQPKDFDISVKVRADRFLYWLYQPVFGGPLQLWRCPWPPAESDRVELVRPVIPVPPGTALVDCRLAACTANQAFYIGVSRWLRGFPPPATLIQLLEWGTGAYSSHVVGPALPPGPVPDPHATAFYLRYDQAEAETPLFLLHSGDMSPGATVPTLVGSYTTSRWTTLATTARNDLRLPTYAYINDRPHMQEAVSRDGGLTWTGGRQEWYQPAVKVADPGAPGNEFTKLAESPVRHYVRTAAVWTDGRGNQVRAFLWHHATPAPTDNQLALTFAQPLLNWEQHVDFENFQPGVVPSSGPAPTTPAPPWTPLATQQRGDVNLGVALGPRPEGPFALIEVQGTLGPRPTGAGVTAYFTFASQHAYRTLSPGPSTRLVTQAPEAAAWDTMDLLARRIPGGTRMTSQDGGDTWVPLATPRRPDGQGPFVWEPLDNVPHLQQNVTLILDAS